MIRRSPIKRTPRKAWRRRPDDRVTEDEGNYVSARDLAVGGCVMAHLDPSHLCHDAFGNQISPAGEYELDHVDNGGTGKRGESTRFNLVRVCPSGHATKTYNARLWRPAFRDYLRSVEGRCWSDAA